MHTALQFSLVKHTDERRKGQCGGANHYQLFVNAHRIKQAVHFTGFHHCFCFLCNDLRPYPRVFIKAETALMHVYKLLSNWVGHYVYCRKFRPSLYVIFCALVREFSVERFATEHSCCIAVLIIIGSLVYVSGFVRLWSLLEGTVSSRESILVMTWCSLKCMGSSV